jgi:DNA repair exonuclease SbcCD ATPase subunit
MNRHTHLKSHETAKTKSDSPEKMQETIHELQKTVAMQYDLLKKTLTENESLQQKVRQLEEQLNDKRNSDGYGSTSSWISKIVFTLQQENRPLRSPELISLLEKREPTLAEHYNKVQYFSAFLSNAVKYGRVIQQKMKGVRGYYYLLPCWMDEGNNIKGEYYGKML